MRRRRAGAAISLFAFQDIITSVSGILIVMVLLLTLELVERPEGESDSQLQASELRDAIAGAETELAARQQNVGTTDDLIREVARWSAAELHQRINEQQQEKESQTRELERLRQQKSRLAEAERVLAAERFDAQQVLEELVETRERNAELEAQAAAEKEDKRPIFTMPRGTQSEGWLVVCEESRVTVARVGHAAPPLVFSGRGGLTRPSAARAFLDWAREQRTTASPYFLLLVRPSGIDTFDEIEAAFHGGGYHFGFDPVARDQVLLDPQRGAAP